MDSKENLLMDTQPVIEPPSDDSTPSSSTSSHFSSGLSPGQETVSTHSSRIVAIVRTNPLLPLSLGTILLSIILPFPIFRILYFALLVILCGTLFHSFRPNWLPFWFRKIADTLIQYLHEKPAESIAFLCIATFAIINRMLALGGLYTGSELISVTLVIFAFYIYGYKPPGRRQTLREYFQRYKDRTSEQTSIKMGKSSQRIPSEEKGVESSNVRSAQEIVWEKRQKERWESWLEEEVERFEGSDQFKKEEKKDN